MSRATLVFAVQGEPQSPQEDGDGETLATRSPGGSARIILLIAVETVWGDLWAGFGGATLLASKHALTNAEYWLAF